MSRPVRTVVVVIGLLLLGAGSVWRSLETDWGNQVVVPPYTEVVEVQDESGVWQAVGREGEVWVEQVGDGSFVVLRAREGEAPVELFRGADEEAQRFRELETGVVLVSGTRAEVGAWLEQYERGAHVLLPNLVLAAGVAVVVGGLLLGRRGAATGRR